MKKILELGLKWITTHEEEEMLVEHRNVGLKPEQTCKPILLRQN